MSHFLKLTGFLLFALLISSCMASRIHHAPAADIASGKKPEHLKIKELACTSPKLQHPVRRNQAAWLVRANNKHSGIFSFQQAGKKKNNPSIKNHSNRAVSANDQLLPSEIENKAMFLPQVPVSDYDYVSETGGPLPAAMPSPVIRTSETLSFSLTSRNLPNREKRLINNIPGKEGGLVQLSVNSGQSQSRPFQKPDNLIYLLGLISGIITLGGLISTPGLAGKISYWAAVNPKKTRFIIGGIQVLTGFAGLILGTEMSHRGMQCSDASRNMLIATFLASALLYPVRKSPVRILKRTYFRQKIHDLLLFISGFLLMVWVGNHFSRQTDYPASLRNTAGTMQQPGYDAFSTFLTPGHQVLYTYEAQLQDEPASPEKKGLSTGAKVLLTVLTIVAFCAAAYGIAAASCGLACSGLNGLAIIVAVAGGLLIIALSYWALKAIYNPKNRRIPKPAPA